MPSLLQPRRFRTLAAIAVLAAGLTFARPSLATDLGFDFWNLPDLRQQIARVEQDRIELDRRDRLVLRSIAVKDSIVEALIAGKLGLFEAAAEFRALNQGRPATVAAVRLLFPAPTDDESMCLNVLNFVGAYVQVNPGARPAAIRIAAELARRRAAGTIELPRDVASLPIGATDVPGDADWD